VIPCSIALSSKGFQQKRVNGKVIVRPCPRFLPYGCEGQDEPPELPGVPGRAQRQIQFQQVVYPFYVFVPSSFNFNSTPPYAIRSPDPLRRRKWAALDPGVEELRGTILVGPTPSGGTFEAVTAPYLYPVIMDAQ